MPHVTSSRRGGAWVAGQVVILGLLAVVGPRTGSMGSLAVCAIAALLMLSGAALALVAGLRLGRSLTPFPKPVANGKLCREGPYRWVRHPIYAAVLLMSIGWALWWQSLEAALLLPVLFAFFAFKARAEERLLAAAYPEYPEYARHVKAIVPFIY